jgi:hypothetical protein
MGSLLIDKISIYMVFAIQELSYIYTHVLLSAVKKARKSVTPTAFLVFACAISSEGSK